MNSNLFHNIANIVSLVLAFGTAALVALGCTTVEATGALECSQSSINPAWTTAAIGILQVMKLLVNTVRDGLSGLTKPQPPVEQ